MLLSIKILDNLDHLQLDIYACRYSLLNQHLLVIYHIYIYWIYKDKVNDLQFSFISDFFLGNLLASNFEISVSTTGGYKKTTNIYNTDSVMQVNCWKTNTSLLSYKHYSVLLLLIHFMCCQFFHSDQIFHWVCMCKWLFIFFPFFFHSFPQ